MQKSIAFRTGPTFSLTRCPKGDKITGKLEQDIVLKTTAKPVLPSFPCPFLNRSEQPKPVCILHMAASFLMNPKA